MDDIGAESPLPGGLPVWRFLAGVLASILMTTGALLIWQSRAEQGQQLPEAPPPASSAPSIIANPQPLQAPEAPAKSREEKRFDRSDKDKNGRITRDELLQPRRKSYAKLDTNKDGRLSFEEWAHTTIDKFTRADRDRNGQLTRAEYATTAPKPAKKKSCAC